MPDDRPLPAAERLARRQLALRAIMDGRGVEAVVLSSPESLAHYGGVGPAPDRRRLLVVTAREAVLVEAARAAEAWADAAGRLPPNCALGHDGGAAEGSGLAALARLARPRRTLSLAAELARQIAGK